MDPRRKEFKIELPQNRRVFALEADTPEDKTDWVNALNAANKTEAFMIDVLNDNTSFNPKEVCCWYFISDNLWINADQPRIPKWEILLYYLRLNFFFLFKYFCTHTVQIITQKEVVKEGFIFKRGQHNKSWKQRWFKLQGHFLLYSAAKADEPLGLIDLQAVRRCAAHDEAEGTNMFQFSLETPNRVFFIYAEDRGVRNEWMQVIQAVLGSESFGTHIKKKVFDMIRLMSI